jgi:hypothetical protein
MGQYSLTSFVSLLSAVAMGLLFGPLGRVGPEAPAFFGLIFLFLFCCSPFIWGFKSPRRVRGLIGWAVLLIGGVALSLTTALPFGLSSKLVYSDLGDRSITDYLLYFLKEGFFLFAFIGCMGAAIGYFSSRMRRAQ